MSSGNNITIRQVGGELSETLTALHESCFPTYWDISSFNNFFSIVGTVAHLAEIDGQPAGMAVHRVLFEQADILTLCVGPDWRRRGVARALLEVVLAQAKAAGAQKLFLEVEDGNVGALALYAQYGFEKAGLRKNYYRQKDGSCTDALVMRVKLA